MRDSSTGDNLGGKDEGEREGREGQQGRGEHTERGRHERTEGGRGMREGERIRDKERLVLTPVVALMHDLI